MYHVHVYNQGENTRMGGKNKAIFIERSKRLLLSAKET